MVIAVLGFDVVDSNVKAFVRESSTECQRHYTCTCIVFHLPVHVSNFISFLPTHSPTISSSKLHCPLIPQLTISHWSGIHLPEIDINGIIDRYVIRYRITEQLGVESSMLPMEINEVQTSLETPL